MSGLLEQVSTDGVHHMTVLQLHCRSCNTVHQLSVYDVERIVYALGAEVAQNLADSEGHDLSTHDEVPFEVECLLLVLESANVGDRFGERVEQGVASRRASVDA